MNNTKKRILFHINSLGLGGAEHVAALLCGRLAAEGMKVILATEWKDEKEYSLPPGVERVDVGVEELDFTGGRAKKAVMRYSKLRRLILEKQPDLVISFMKKANVRAALALSGLKIPLIISVRNDPARDYSGGMNGFTNLLLKKKARGCVFQTSESKNFFGREFAAKSKVILNPLDDKYVKLNNTLVRDRKYGDIKKIIAVGRITEQKNHMLLIKAFEYVLDKLMIIKEKGSELVSEITLEIYGKDGAMKNAVQDYVEGRALLKDHVYLPGTTDNLQEVYSAGDMFVLSSDYEGMPNVLMEAMAMGIPCISTDCPCGGPREIIENGENGILVPVGDKEGLGEAMLDLILHPDKAEKIGKRAALTAERVNPDRIYGEWRNYISEVVG